jgi:hypothetical protein
MIAVKRRRIKRVCVRLFNGEKFIQAARQSS